MENWQIRAKEHYFSSTLTNELSWQQVEALLREEFAECQKKPRDFYRSWCRNKSNADWYRGKVKGKITYENKKEVTQDDVENLIATVKQMQKANNAIDGKQTKISITLEETKPVIIAYWSDWHLGGIGVDYEKFDEHKEIIKHTDGLYWIGGGDYKDGYAPKMPFGQNEQIIPVGTQDLYVSREMQYAGDNCLALVRGCHDDWEHQQSDKDFIQYLCDKIDAVNLWHGGDVYIKLGKEEYHFKCRHKYKFESSLNKSNAMRRIMEMQGVCDVALSAHLHDPYKHSDYLMGGWRVLGRSGSYKLWDEHGQKLAGYKGKSGIPCVIIFPDKHHMVDMFLDDAVDYLKALRA